MLPVSLCGSGRSKRVPFVSEVFLQRLTGELGTPYFPKDAQFLPMKNICNRYTVLLHDTSHLTKDGLKCIIPSKAVPFGGVSNVPLNFGSQTPQK